MRLVLAVVAHLRLFFKREPWVSELCSALTALGWVSLSYVSRDNLAYWPSMKVLLSIGDDRFWHLLGLALGIGQFLFVIFDQWLLRWMASLVLCWFWCVLTLGVWYATPWAPAVAVYAGWGAANLFSVIRLPRRPGVS